MAIQNHVSASGKIILWAHHSHVNHASLGITAPSMGRSLLEMLGSKLYTIGLFAASGEARRCRRSGTQEAAAGFGLRD
jgi:erythromycin esterase-like protein